MTVIYNNCNFDYQKIYTLVKLLDKSFEVFISKSEIQDKVLNLAGKINSDFFKFRNYFC